MTYSIDYEHDTKGVLITITGPITGSDVYKINAEMYASKELPCQRYQIWDCTQSESINITPDEIRGIAFQDRDAAEKNPEQVVALVGSKHYWHGIDRVYRVYADVWTGFESQTFGTVEEARKWIQQKIMELG